MNAIEILEIMEKEDIRRIDGRYSKGFVDTDILENLIKRGDVVVYRYGGLDFVTRANKLPSPLDKE